MATSSSPSPPDIDGDLLALSDALAALPPASDVALHNLRQLLDSRLDDLKKLLDNPPKNDASRKMLQDGAAPTHGHWRVHS